MVKFTFLVAFFICSGIATGNGLRCYAEVCRLNKTTRDWTCEKVRNDSEREEECKDDCAEATHSHDFGLMYRDCSYYLEHGHNITDQGDGKVCSEMEVTNGSDMSKMTRTICHCKTPLCNRFFKTWKD